MPFLSFQGKFEEAEPLYKRSVAIDEALYGPDHPDVAGDLNNWASSLFQQVKPVGTASGFWDVFRFLTLTLYGSTTGVVRIEAPRDGRTMLPGNVWSAVGSGLCFTCFGLLPYNHQIGSVGKSTLGTR